MRSGWVYILQCSDGTYYTGSTNNLERRLLEHQEGEGANYTKTRKPIKLVYYEFHQFVSAAFNREKQIQGWSRKKKETLINNNRENLPYLSMAHWNKFE